MPSLTLSQISFNRRRIVGLFSGSRFRGALSFWFFCIEVTKNIKGGAGASESEWELVGGRVVYQIFFNF